jgi:ADP-heptose:LPS heptosyltransferase
LLAGELLRACLAGEAWPRHALNDLIEAALSPDESVALDASSALFAELVEPLCDSFEPRLVNLYVEIFSRVCERVLGLDASRIVDRYERIRQVRRFQAAEDPDAVFVLSRITLGADVAVTSVLLDALLKRFPKSDIVFVGPRKNYELFAGDDRIRHLPLSYGRRSSLRERLAHWKALGPLLGQPRSIVVDPDSRLTQLGLLPICPDELYYFFESRCYSAASSDPLSTLAARWAADVFGEDARPFLCPHQPEAVDPPGTIAVSLGVGENMAKRAPEPFERELMEMLAATGAPILIDKGAGGEERERVEQVIASLPRNSRVTAVEGSFAPFAARIARSRLYVGYDSAGQHVAAAAGVPLVTVFSGFTSDRMCDRWRPAGAGGPVEVVRVTQGMTAGQVLHYTFKALCKLGLCS